MKKILICFLTISILMMVCSCGEEQNSNIDNSINEQTQNNQESNNANTNKVTTIDDTQNITVESLRKAKETPSNDFEYEKVDGGISITRYSGQDKMVNVPDSIDGNSVVSIGDYAFANNEVLQAVKISDSVKVIEEQAFGNCTNLKILLCGSALETIEKYAFNHCSSLSTVELNDGLINMNRLCFGSTAFTEIVIPSSVETMDYPFYADAGEKIVVIGESGSRAESYATELGADYGLEFKAK